MESNTELIIRFEISNIRTALMWWWTKLNTITQNYSHVPDSLSSSPRKLLFIFFYIFIVWLPFSVPCHSGLNLLYN